MHSSLEEARERQRERERSSKFIGPRAQPSPQRYRIVAPGREREKESGKEREQERSKGSAQPSPPSTHARRTDGVRTLGLAVRKAGILSAPQA